MEQLVTALISAAIVVIGTLATFIKINLTNKTVQSNSCEVVKTLTEINKKLEEIEKKYTQIEYKLNKSEIRNEKRLLKIEQDIVLLQQSKDMKVEVKTNEERL